MTINFNCPHCGKSYKLKDELSGKKGRCSDCKKTFIIPTVYSKYDIDLDEEDLEPEDDYEDDEDLEEDYPKKRPSFIKPSKSKKSASRKKSKPSIFSSVWFWVLSLIGGGVFLSCTFCIILAYNFESILRQQALKEAGLGNAKIVEHGPPESLFPVNQVQIPDFPDLGFGNHILDSDTSVFLVQMQLPSGKYSYPGQMMSFRVYIPENARPDKSLPCVLIAPAGTNMLHGNNLDDGDYHKEALPYAQAGIVAVLYSLDGAVDDSNESKTMIHGYVQFHAAMAGVVNGRNALEFALAKLPMVNPKQIFTAGHSSAGTLSLLMAEHEPRLAGAIAYAPCTDLEKRLKMEDGVNEIIFYKYDNFIKQSSPNNHIPDIKMSCFSFPRHG